MDIVGNVVSKCCICGEPGELAFTKSPYEIHKCTNCDFLFVNHHPSSEELNAFYNTDYRDINISFYPKAHSRQRRTFLKSFRLMVQSVKYGRIIK